MKRTLRYAVVILFFTSYAVLAQDIEATTADGRKVVLKPDGTYQFVQRQVQNSAGAAVSFQKPDSSTTSMTLKGDKFTIWYDSARWLPQKTSDPSRFEFAHRDGDVYGLIIAERIAMQQNMLRDMAIKNAQNVSSDVKVTFEETRKINSTDLLCMKMQGTIQGIAFTFYGYYYAGNSGTIQVATFTSSNLFSQYEPQMLDFLNGIVIKE